MLLSFQTGFNLANVAVVCAILESISDLEPSSVTTQPRYLKLYFDLCVNATGVVINLIFAAMISMPSALEALSRRSTNFASSSSFPAKPSMSSAKRRLVIVLLPMLLVIVLFPMLTVPS